MWTPCPVGINHTSKLLGLELEDCAIAFFTPIVVSGWVDTIESFVVGALVGVALYIGKRGKPPGTLFQQLHGIELLRLPGVLSPAEQTYGPR